MTTYSISLDDVDLALLPLPTHSYNNFLKKEHYQFQMMKSVMESTTLYTCHICAIDVPVAFAYEHAASVKHQANVRIASVAAERMRAFISTPPPQFVKPAGRFCANCAIEVDEGHEKTREHRNAAMLDKLLWDLMNAYVQDDDKAIFNNKPCDNNDSGKINEFKNVQDDNEAIVNNKTCDNNGNGKINEFKNDVSFKIVGGININNSMVTKCTKNNQPTDVIDEVTDEEDQIEENSTTTTTDMIEECSEDEELSTNENEYDQSLNFDTSKNIAEESMAEKATNVTCIEHYEETLRQFLNENDCFEYKESVKISVRLNEYSLINIDSGSFHSYDKLYFSDNIKCIVCDCLLDYEEAEVHKYDFEHLCIIANFGDDGHYVREIDELYSHCILCNRKIENIEIETHKQDPMHNINMSIYTRTNTRSIRVTDKMKKEEITEEKINESQSHKTVSSIEYPYEITAMGKIRCVVCECEVPSGVRNREEHVKGIRHRTTVNKIP